MKFLLAATVLFSYMAKADMTCVNRQPNYGGSNTAFQISDANNAQLLLREFQNAHSIDYKESQVLVDASYVDCGGVSSVTYNDDLEYYITKSISVKLRRPVSSPNGPIYFEGKRQESAKNGYTHTDEIVCFDGTLEEFYLAHGKTMFSKSIFYIPEFLIGEE